MSDGFVVTPSMMPRSASAWISLTFPVSTNSFISNSSLTNRFLYWLRRRAPVGRRRSVDGDDPIYVRTAAARGGIQVRWLGDRFLRQRRKFVTRRFPAQDHVAAEIGLRIGFP